MLLRVQYHQKMVGDGMKLSATFEVDLARLPPCENSLIAYVQCVNYRVACYKRANEALFGNQCPMM